MRNLGALRAENVNIWAKRRIHKVFPHQKYPLNITAMDNLIKLQRQIGTLDTLPNGRSSPDIFLVMDDINQVKRIAEYVTILGVIMGVTLNIDGVESHQQKQSISESIKILVSGIHG